MKDKFKFDYKPGEVKTLALHNTEIDLVIKILKKCKGFKILCGTLVLKKKQ